MSNAKPTTEQELIEVLDLVGAKWMSSQTCSTVLPWAGEHGVGMTVEGPAFCYQWTKNRPSLEACFIASGSIRLATGASQSFAIEIGRGNLRVQIPERDPQILGALVPATYEQIVDLVGEAQNASGHIAASWNHSMSLAACAMHMLTLTHEAAMAASENHSTGNRSPKKDQLISQLHEWLRPNLSQSVKLADAAKRFDKSPRQLIRILKETTGTGFAEHLSMHRLILARSLLMRTDQSVQEVAKAAGFNSREQFIRSYNKAFGWTPLQFRKAWNRASLSESALTYLCQVSGRAPVNWLSSGVSAQTPDTGKEGQPHTVVVANGIHEIVELFWVSPQGKLARIDVLEHGGMVFVNRDNGGSAWMVRAATSGLERYFTTPDDHALAVVSNDLPS